MTERPRTLLLTAPRTLEFGLFPQRELAPHEVRLRGITSAVSHGTELNHYRGSSPFASKRFDVATRRFVDAPGLDPYPMELGYGMVAEVIEVGEDVTGLEPGDPVFSGTPHQEEAIVDPRALAEYGTPIAKLPKGVPTDPALYISLAIVSLRAIHDAGIGLGDHVAVYGLGVVGLLTARMAKLSGAGSVVGVDPVAERRELALRFGATLEGSGPASGADVAIETSGTYSGLHDAIASVRLGGRVVTVGYYRGSAEPLRLGEEWHHNRPTMISSMGVWGAPHRDYPLWDARRITDTAVALLYGDELDVSPISVHRFPFREAPRAYRELDASSGEILKAAFDYARP